MSFVRRPATVFLILSCVTVVVIRAQQQTPQRGGQQTPAAPTGPLAPEVYKNIQVLKDVQADQIDVAMRFVAASLGWQCINCHVQDAATGDWAFDKDDKRPKQTARDMMKMMKTINDTNFNGQVRVTCATCHNGHNQPNPRPPLAETLTPDQIAAAQQQQAARQGAPGTPPGPPPAGAAQGGAGTPAAGGRGGPGGQPPAVPVDDIINRYVDALGGKAALEKLQSLVLAGNMTGRMGMTMPFTIEEKLPNAYRETLQAPNGTIVRAFDGSVGWVQVGTGRVNDLSGFSLQQALRIADLGLPQQLKEKYQGLQARRGPGTRISGKETIALTGRPASGVTETLFFETDSGLLVRRAIATATPLGQLVEQIDYADYRDVAGVKVPFTIIRTSWNSLDTLKVVDVKPNAQINDAVFGKPK